MQTRRPDARIRIAAALGIAAAVATAPLVAQSEVLDMPQLNALVRTLILSGAIGSALLTWSLRPYSRMGPVLMAISFAFAVTTLQALPQPLLHGVGRLMLPVCAVLLLYAFLIFPSGRLEGHGSRQAIAVAVATMGAAWLLTALVDSPLPETGLLSRCQGACPDNPFQLFDASPGLADFAALAVAGAQALSACLVALVLLRRLRAGTPVERVTLGAAFVLLAVLAVGYVVAFGLRLGGADQAAASLGWLYAPLFVVIPIALLIGQVRGRLFAGIALRRMLVQLGPHPSPIAVEQHMATAFGDPTLRVAYRALEGGDYIDALGHPLAVPAAPGPGVAELWDGGERVAVILHDPVLDDVPGLMDAAGSATLLTVRNARLSAELRASVRALQASRARIAAAVDEARRELEHDLADDAQSRLAAVAARLAGAADGVDDPDLRALLAELRGAVAEAAETLDDAAHGIYPRPLVEQGVTAALRARLEGTPAVVEQRPLARGPEECEAAVFFACLEAAQNALKHAGEHYAVTVALHEHDGSLRFAVHDDGGGFDVAEAANGGGLANIRDRIEAVGGHVTIASSHARGTTILGSVPWRAATLNSVPALPFAAATAPPR